MTRRNVIVELITITITGTLANDPRPFTTSRGTAAVSLWLESSLPPRGGGESVSRYMKILAFGTLASNVTESLHRGDRITIRGDDLRAETWEKDGQTRSCVTVVAFDICPSLLRDTAVTGRAARRAAAQAAADGEPADLPAAAQADLKVLAGVTAGAADAA
jgi:single-strand DNA-binding protein